MGRPGQSPGREPVRPVPGVQSTVVLYHIRLSPEESSEVRARARLMLADWNLGRMVAQDSILFAGQIRSIA